MVVFPPVGLSRASRASATPPELPNGRALACAALFLFLLTLSTGTPGFAQDPAPAVTRIYLDPPLSGDTYVLGERVVAWVEFDREVVRTGQPTLMLQIGDRARSAVFHGWSTTRLGFRYVVQASDHDDDGVSIPANALSLNGASIKGVGGNDADLSHELVPDNPERKVNGSLKSTPTVTRIFFVNTPSSGDTYGLGEEVEAWVEFDGPVVATGRPRLMLQIGDRARPAVFRFGWANRLDFRYVVQASDRDDDGISIPANSLSLNGGSIEGVGGNDADLSHDAVPDNPERKVNGSSASPLTVDQVSVVNRPLSGGDTFGPGEEIRVQVRFSRALTVTGNPRLVLQIGDQTRGADLYSQLSDKVLAFRHFVEASDRDDDGISIPANAIRLNRGSIGG